MSAAALLEQVTEELYACHTADVEAAQVARLEYETRRGKVHQDDELWEPWSAAFVEWYVVERVAPGQTVPPAAVTFRERTGDEAAAIRALVTSHRSLFEIRAVGRGRVELLDLLGGAEIEVDETRALHGVEVGDVAELRLVGSGDAVRFGRTLHLSPEGRAWRDRRAGEGAAREGLPTRRDVIDAIAHLRVQVTRYRHMPAARVYELGSRIVG